ncbi:MAG: DoxX family protein [Bdellovibrio sp. CG10_big_fil_rev_8_21_14_0_10_47_8]|nr:MAG: DoxX family protein [Bdellovibrio sp. CG10_big_fil_rev_8_21_14_0_10_47_8]
MEKCLQLYSLMRECLRKIEWLAPLLARFTIGVVFIESGWGKLHNLEKVIDFFQSLGIPAAQYQAPFVAGVELVAGTLILVGLATRLASIPLIGTMIVAIITAKKDDISGWTDLFGISEFLYVVLLIWILLAGPGKASIDEQIKKRTI